MFSFDSKGKTCSRESRRGRRLAGDPHTSLSVSLPFQGRGAFGRRRLSRPANSFPRNIADGDFHSRTLVGRRDIQNQREGDGSITRTTPGMEFLHSRSGIFVCFGQERSQTRPLWPSVSHVLYPRINRPIRALDHFNIAHVLAAKREKKKKCVWP